MAAKIDRAITVATIVINIATPSIDSDPKFGLLLIYAITAIRYSNCLIIAM